jgi:hypothetical protein
MIPISNLENFTLENSISLSQRQKECRSSIPDFITGMEYSRFQELAEILLDNV